jgi:hypothetical protein
MPATSLLTWSTGKQKPNYSREAQALQWQFRLVSSEIAFSIPPCRFFPACEPVAISPSPANPHARFVSSFSGEHRREGSARVSRREGIFDLKFSDGLYCGKAL